MMIIRERQEQDETI